MLLGYSLKPGKTLTDGYVYITDSDTLQSSRELVVDVIDYLNSDAGNEIMCLTACRSAKYGDAIIDAPCKLNLHLPSLYMETVRIKSPDRYCNTDREFIDDYLIIGDVAWNITTAAEIDGIYFDTATGILHLLHRVDYFPDKFERGYSYSRKLVYSFDYTDLVHPLQLQKISVPPIPAGAVRRAALGNRRAEDVATEILERRNLFEIEWSIVSEDHYDYKSPKPRLRYKPTNKSIEYPEWVYARHTSSIDNNSVALFRSCQGYFYKDLVDAVSRGDKWIEEIMN